MGENCGSYNTVRCGNEEIPSDAVPVRAEEFMEYIRGRVDERDEDEERAHHQAADDDHHDSDSG